MERNKYEREIIWLNGEKAIVDAYRTLSAFKVTDPACQHAIKKLFMHGDLKPQVRYHRP